ncbi:type II toxin-antitoxin system PemK/MazF family toxin [Tannockella kyphosi]|uniref:type II toxin-antitoxin system PemK/MazF family toxin n=1 Tax=Tannockella kyphosi TaxID=2899121 RepID=UPI002013010A|nr:type II toxin-antitoxin system PemK/MazF family toxin [Tannockella kyphosi]
MQKSRIYRGDIYYCDLEPVKGSVQGGVRPVLIIQNQIGNDYAPTLIVAVITTNMKKLNQPTHIVIGKNYGLEDPSMVMLEQIKTIDKSELRSYVGRISEPFTIQKINQALEISLGLKNDGI